MILPPASQASTTTVAATASVVASSLAAGGGSAAGDLQGLIVVGLMPCSSPYVKGVAEAGRRAVLPLHIGSGESSGLIGCLVIIGGIGLAHFVGSVMFFRLFPQKCGEAGFKGALGMLRFPSRTYSISGALWQGVSYECVRIVMLGNDSSRKPADLVITVVTLIIILTQPLFLVYYGVAKAKDCAFVPFTGTKRRSMLLAPFRPVGYWVCESPTENMMRSSYGSFTATKHSALHLLPLLRSLAISILVLAAGNVGCSVQSGLLVAVFVLSLLPLLVLKAHAFRLQTTITTFSTAVSIVVILSSVIDSLARFSAVAITALTILTVCGSIGLLLSRLVRDRWRKQQAENGNSSSRGSNKDDTAVEMVSPSAPSSAPSNSSLLQMPTDSTVEERISTLANPLLQGAEMTSRH